MSSIPPNIIGSIFQAQVSSTESAKKTDAERAKKARDSEKMVRLADQQQHEVEDTDHAEQTRIRRQDERKRSGQDSKDTYDAHDPNSHGKIYHSQTNKTELPPESPGDDPPTDHIDLTA
ncbi:MAG: hypothetical protein GY869_05345 [Planctomycetes bacterium]|nr:hypothetical protein [Planctomycetota bacterium]